MGGPKVSAKVLQPPPPRPLSVPSSPLPLIPPIPQYNIHINPHMTHRRITHLYNQKDHDEGDQNQP